MKNIVTAVGEWAASAGAALASADSLPVDGGLGMLPARSGLAEDIQFFHNGILVPLITIITLLVLALLLWVVVRYNAKANPTPKKFSHNTVVEVIWTGIPILILLAIFLPSLDLLYREGVIPDGKEVVFVGDGVQREIVFANDFNAGREIVRKEHIVVHVADAAGVKVLSQSDYKLAGLGKPEVRVSLNEAPAAGERVIVRGGRTDEATADCAGWTKLFGACQGDIALAPTVTIKAIGFQWGWTYAYPDFGDFEFTSLMLPREQTTQELYRYDTDNEIVVPVGESIRIITTARDVLHAWAMPNFGIKIDAVPGRLNETWFRAQREGVYFGQCSEICGVKHAFMPIEVRVVSRPEFEAWVDGQRAMAGMEPMFGATKVALAAE